MEGDLYKTLGVRREASREEIKDAFRKLALKFHPDKHSPDSSPAQRDAATLRFKHLSEAYDVLSDDRKRAAYNRLRPSSSPSFHSNYNSYYNSNHTYNNKSAGFGRSHAYRDFWLSALQLLRARSFLLNSTFACALLGGSYVVHTSKETLWNMHNPGKSFEETMESIKKAKAHGDRK